MASMYLVFENVGASSYFIKLHWKANHKVLTSIWTVSCPLVCFRQQIAYVHICNSLQFSVGENESLKQNVLNKLKQSKNKLFVFILNLSSILWFIYSGYCLGHRCIKHLPYAYAIWFFKLPITKLHASIYLIQSFQFLCFLESKIQFFSCLICFRLIEVSQ